MKLGWIAVAAAAVAFSALAADPALARSKHHSRHHVAKRDCAPNPPPPSLGDWFFSVRPKPQPNGCSPPVHASGEFIGQDPDINIRHALRRNPEEGFGRPR